jgi:hypothetical protein
LHAPGRLGGDPVCVCIPTPPSPTNISRNKPSWQSTTAYGGIAARGNDGDTEGNFWLNSVTHTGTGLVWPGFEPADGQHWYVYLSPDFGPERLVTSVTLYNRSDCCQERLKYFNVLAWNSYDEEWQVIADHGNDPTVIQNSITFDFSDNMILTRYVMVAKTDTDHLSLAEVRVMGF